MNGLYAGCDLHGNNNLIGIIDGEGKRVFKKKLPNDLAMVRDTLKAFQEKLVGLTLLICFSHSRTNDGRGRRYSSYGRNTLLS
jgi:hypothetical protein